MMSDKAIARALRGLFVIAAALLTELVTSLLPTGEVSTLTDIQEYVSNEGNTQVETLSENVNEAMDTDQRQTSFGINRGKDLERLTSDVMNQKVSPNDLAESQELVKLDNTLARLKNTLRSTRERQSFGCIAWTTLRSSRTSYVARDWNLRWTYECHHRIIESFRSDMSYSLCQVCSTLYPGNEQASFNSSLAAPEVC